MKPSCKYIQSNTLLTNVFRWYHPDKTKWYIATDWAILLPGQSATCIRTP